MNGDASGRPSHAERARTVVSRSGTGTLSTIARNPAGYPFGSSVLYALDDRGRPLLSLSKLAEHTRNLDVDPRASLLVCQDPPAGTDPLASGRVTLIGSAERVDDPAEVAGVRDVYLEAHPESHYVDFDDFSFHRLDVVCVRYVGGFGEMSWVDLDAYAGAGADAIGEGGG